MNATVRFMHELFAAYSQSPWRHWHSPNNGMICLYNLPTEVSICPFNCRFTFHNSFQNISFISENPRMLLNPFPALGWGGCRLHTMMHSPPAKELLGDGRITLRFDLRERELWGSKADGTGSWSNPMMGFGIRSSWTFGFYFHKINQRLQQKQRRPLKEILDNRGMNS